MPSLPYDDWVDIDVYLEEMARMHKIYPKMDMIRVVQDQLNKLASDTNYKPLGVTLTQEEKKWLAVELAGQIVALSMELTDDLASVCEAYLNAISTRDKSVVVNIANFQRGDGNAFYERVSADPNEAGKAMGLDPAATPQDELEAQRRLLDSIRLVRAKHWMFYNGYKHGQYATPIVFGEGTADEKWGWYLIPKALRTSGNRVHTQGGERFIEATRLVTEFVAMANVSVGLWNETVRRQYPKVFGKSLP